MHDKLTELYGAEFECAVERLVEQCRPEFEREVMTMFKAARTQPCTLCEIPIVGSLRNFVYSPHEQSHRVLEEVVTQALCARKWFEFEAPLWANPLPLTEEAIIACFNRGRDRRSLMVGKYARLLRELRWNYKNATPFEVYCAG